MRGRCSGLLDVGLSQGFHVDMFTLCAWKYPYMVLLACSGENDVQLAGVPRSRGVLSPQLLVAGMGLIVNSSDKLGFERLIKSLKIFN